MTKCATCGTENEDSNMFCKHCGTKLKLTSEDDVKNAAVKRFEAIKNKDEAAIKALMDPSYTKYDDWPPYQRQEGAQALENETSAFKVLSNYTYELRDFKANVIEDVAVATFIIHYQGTMRNQQFNFTSRVTMVFRKQDSTWKIIHEHLSRFPEERQWQQQQQFGRGGGFGRGRFPFQHQSDALL
jgi:ketosteroid isomerase-like protein